MAFFRQLRILLWKNLMLRVRSPVKTSLELLLPLIFFIILAIVRLRDLKANMGECHFRAKPLPSAGVIPFVQGFFCNWNNTCYHRSQQSEAPSQVTSFNQSLLTKAIVDLEKLLLDKKISHDVAEVMKDLQVLQEFVNALRNPDNVTKISNHTVLSIPISHVVNNITTIRQTLAKHNVNFTDHSWNLLRSAQIDLTKLVPNVSVASIQKLIPILLTNATDLIKAFPNLDAAGAKEMACNESSALYKYIHLSVENGTESLRDILCNRSAAELLEIFQAFRNNINPQKLNTEIRTIIRNVTTKEVATGPDMINRFANLVELIRKSSSILDLVQHIQDIAKEMGGLVPNGISSGSSTPLNGTLGQIARFSNFLCGASPDGNDVSRLIQQIANRNIEFGGTGGFLRRRKRALSEDMKQSLYCSEINRLFNRGPMKYVWRQMKTIIFGKVFYAPDNAATRKIIAKANATFDDMAFLYKSAKRWLTIYSPALNKTLNLDPRMNMLRSLVDLCASGKVPGIPAEYLSICQRAKIFLSKGLKESLKATPFNWRDALKYVDNIADQMKYAMGCFEYDKFYGVANETELMKIGKEGLRHGFYWAGIVFDDMPANGTMPRIVKTRIRMDSDKVDGTRDFRVFDRYWRPRARSRPWPDLKYFTFGFIYLQDMIERAVIELQTKRPLQEGTYMQQFPYPCYVYDKFTRAISNFLPMFMTLAWIFAVSMTVRSIVYEKELRLKEFMRVMGLSNGVHWTAWFITTFVVLLFSVLLMLLVLKVGSVIHFTSASVLFVLLVSFLISTISQSFLISVFFSKANLAAACAGLIYFSLYLPYNLVTIREEVMTESDLTGLSLLCQVAFGIACQYIARFEEQGVGAQWHNLWLNPSQDDTFSIGKVILMMWFDALIYAIFTWYIEAVFPGEYGVPQPWYFPVLKRYWCPDSNCKDDENVADSATLELPNRDSANLEPDPTNLRVGVSIRNLRKVYGWKDVPAVDGLNLNFYENQITSFLGHNGAGKTTTISILTGLYTPSSGTATICGLDIRTEMTRIRQRLGLCPQYNVLFDNLTVEEHIRFYGLLKGVSSDKIDKEIERYVHEVGLPHKRKDLAHNLSGGMKRKLSVAMAFVGGSKVIILDEPTAGVDPYARRCIWEILLKCRHNRTIVLTTHHMDEAEVLGDRIAIISRGRLKCCGSRFFLKNRFGKGYHLSLEKASIPDAMHEDEKGEEEEETMMPKFSAPAPINVGKISALIQDHVPEATLFEEVSTELTYLLPYSSVDQGQLEKLLMEMEAHQPELGISSFGLSDSTLEEVFLAVAEDPSETAPDRGAHPRPVSRSSFRRKKPFRLLRNNSISSSQQELMESVESMDRVSIAGSDISGPDSMECPDIEKPLLSGTELIIRQFFALMVKRLHNVRRSKKGFVAEIILPPLFILIAVLLSTLWPGFTPHPPMEVHPWLMQPRRHQSNMYFFYSNDRPKDSVTQRYEQILRTGVGSGGTRCMDPKTYVLKGFPCVKDGAGSWTAVPKGSVRPKEPRCSCASGHQVCPAKGDPPKPSFRLMETTDIMYNLTGYNITDYLLRRAAQFRTKMFGGISLGEINADAALQTQLPNGPNISALPKTLERLIFAASNRSVIDEDAAFWKRLETVLTSRTEVRNNAKVWFMNKGYASSIAYLNVINNLHLRANLPPGTATDTYGLSTWTHPMEFTPSQLNKEARKMAVVDSLTSIVVIFALAFIPASFVLFLIDERTSNTKHLQFVSGVNRNVYWIANFCWDILNYIVPLILCLIIFVAFQKQAFVSKDNIGAFIFLLVIYGLAIIPMMYPASFVFSTPSTAFVLLSCINLIIGMVTTLSTFVIEMLRHEEPDLEAINDVLKKIFLIFPQYCLGRGLIDLSTNHLGQELMQAIGSSSRQRSPLEWNFLGKNIFCLVVESMIFFALTLLIENRFFYHKWYHPKVPELKEPDHEDDDVVRERERVLASDPNEDAMSVRRLTKIYRAMKTRRPAVNQISFGLKKGECFGLLGVNGAGKTSTFKMLTGDERVSAGDAFVGGHSILSEMMQVHLNIGYCPQFDAFNANLTGRETLSFFARLRGVREADVPRLVDWVLRRMSLTPHADKVTQSYSGGNKRKLSTAIALVADPPVMFLDEPTSGMDPGARRFLWNCINRAVNEGRSVVLTSHSMEECEALCHRLAIMVNGQFRCLGSNQRLKSKFGEGYTVTLRLGNSPNCDKVSEFIDEKFAGSVLKERHYNVLRFQLPLHIRLSLIFAEINASKVELGIEDYSVSQTTLDEVFINFAKDQSDMLSDERDVRRTEDEVFIDEFADIGRAPSLHGSSVILMSRSSSQSSLPFSWSRAGSQNELIVTSQSGAANNRPMKTTELRLNMSDIDV